MVTLAKVINLELSVNPSNPVQEAVDVVLLLVNTHPGRQRELLQQIDMQIGEALAALDKASKKAADEKIDAELSEPVK
ncbi:hypothetical protein [Paenibacillus sp. DMB5]|uniref:hypothetical protein n=1 Tax=Paenibacillus sp. DMB5 TaxID=1780103 RepID=UPI00076CF75A|nr:hypothetical protein [Paenibacillus sp. DMB5]KUP22426.1 hypothetical protein AWJ19_27815 [Paenibacillus sp. DMB5]